MKRSKSCGCSHEAHERKGTMPRKMKKPMKKMVGSAVQKSKAGQMQLGGGGKLGR